MFAFREGVCVFFLWLFVQPYQIPVRWVALCRNGNNFWYNFSALLLIRGLLNVFGVCFSWYKNLHQQHVECCTQYFMQMYIQSNVKWILHTNLETLMVHSFPQPWSQLSFSVHHRNALWWRIKRTPIGPFLCSRYSIRQKQMNHSTVAVDVLTSINIGWARRAQGEAVTKQITLL